MLDHVYLNGAYVSRDAARLHTSDLGLLRGYGVFDYFRYVAGAPRFVDDHVARFRRSAAGLGLEVPLTDAEVRNLVAELIDRNGGGDGGIRLLLTGGYAEDGYTVAQPNLLGLPSAYTAPAPGLYARGCSALLHRYERQLPRLKTTDYLEGIRIQPQLRARGVDFALYVDRGGRVRESDRSNVMIVRDGALIAPVDDILLGVTRAHLLTVARSLGIPTEERAVWVAELADADEALICSSVKGAMPLTQIDGRRVGDGAVGAVTRRLMVGWEAYVADPGEGAPERTGR